jgi:chromatin remodeling complex protein RSC6
MESAYKQDVKKVSKTKRKRKGGGDPTGFIKTHPVPEKLAQYIGVDSGVELSGPDVTKKVWAAIKNKGLQYEKDGRVLRTDKETNDVFGLNDTVNKSTDHNDKDGFNFRNIQKYISYALHNK